MTTQVAQNSFRSTNLDDGWLALEGGQNATEPSSYALLPSAGDGFMPTYPSYPGSTSPTQQGGTMNQLAQMMQSLMGMLQQFLGGQSSALPGASSGGGQTTFGNATISSTGDPHLAINGTLGDGSNVSLKYDDMQSDPNLASSDSFTGGYRVSTQATTPSANGVTYNQCATVTTNFGQDQVSFDQNGNATILQNGAQVPIGAGQTVNLGNGESVTDNGNSLVVADQAANGGNITTTMTQNGSGVDVAVNAQNVDLGGNVVRKALGQSRRSAAV
jgi:hypothetical protein